ncbi:MAG: acetate--CoA ligase family protein [Candidatus Aminicenantes bacterium]|nr:acetate--CoA ligase family protein [Candidatus Aminicenantes bacterium]
MREIFYPNSVAVIGVSSKTTNLGRNIMANLIDFGFRGIVYAVGPSGGVFATRRIYQTIQDIPDHVDLAVVLTPAHTIPEIFEQCGQKGIRWAVVETAGFREYGEKGKEIEEEMLRAAEKYGIRFVGPNCIGIINTENGLSLPFARLEPLAKVGDVSLISQSGGIAVSVLNFMVNEGLGLNKFVSAGNMLSIGAEELLEYMIEDPGTRIIFLYLEGIQDGRRLMEVARRSPKPILVFKSNVGHLGKGIASSHTASLSSDDKVVDAAFRQSGITRVHDATSLLNNMKVLHLPPVRGKKLAIISRSGGHAVVAADACELSGFELADFPPDFIREIESHFRASVIKLTNPLDLGDLFDLDVYDDIVERTLKQPWVDAVLFLHTSISRKEHSETRELIQRFLELSKKYDKPVAAYVSTPADETAYLKETFPFPIFTTIVETIRALEFSYSYHAQLNEVKTGKEIPSFTVEREPVKNLIIRAQKEKRDLLLSEAVDVLTHYGIEVVPSISAVTIEEAQNAAEKLGYPVAMKVVAESVSHKSDAGGVQLNLRNKAAVIEAFEDMNRRIRKAYPDAKLDGVLVQPMVTGGRELIVGGRQDVQFGPVVIVGMGGVYVEVFEEVALRIAPISRLEAESMIEELRGAPILKGVRGHKRSDLEAVVDVILRVSLLLSDFPEIKELDINPLRVFHENEGCQALDARIILGD